MAALRVRHLDLLRRRALIAEAVVDVKRARGVRRAEEPSAPAAAARSSTCSRVRKIRSPRTDRGSGTPTAGLRAGCWFGWGRRPHRAHKTPTEGPFAAIASDYCKRHT